MRLYQKPEDFDEDWAIRRSQRYAMSADEARSLAVRLAILMTFLVTGAAFTIVLLKAINLIKAAPFILW
ncbi:MAG: hypothetical protein AAGH92_03455 [Planctomycetota bacterium]